MANESFESLGIFDFETEATTTDTVTYRPDNNQVFVGTKKKTTIDLSDLGRMSLPDAELAALSRCCYGVHDSARAYKRRTRNAREAAFLDELANDILLKGNLFYGILKRNLARTHNE